MIPGIIAWVRRTVGSAFVCPLMPNSDIYPPGDTESMGNSEYGWSVSVDNSISTIVVSAHEERSPGYFTTWETDFIGAVYIYNRNPDDSWTMVQKIINTNDVQNKPDGSVGNDDNFGSKVMLAKDNKNVLLITTYGNSFIYRRNVATNLYELERTIEPLYYTTPSGYVYTYIPCSAILSDAGDYVVLGYGDSDTDNVDCLKYENGAWVSDQTITKIPGVAYFGINVCLNKTADKLILSCNTAADWLPAICYYVKNHLTGIWEFQQLLSLANVYEHQFWIEDYSGNHLDSLIFDPTENYILLNCENNYAGKRCFAMFKKDNTGTYSFLTYVFPPIYNRDWAGSHIHASENCEYILYNSPASYINSKENGAIWLLKKKEGSHQYLPMKVIHPDINDTLNYQYTYMGTSLSVADNFCSFVAGIPFHTVSQPTGDNETGSAFFVGNINEMYNVNIEPVDSSQINADSGVFDWNSGVENYETLTIYSTGVEVYLNIGDVITYSTYSDPLLTETTFATATLFSPTNFYTSQYNQWSGGVPASHTAIEAGVFTIRVGDRQGHGYTQGRLTWSIARA